MLGGAENAPLYSSRFNGFCRNTWLIKWFNKYKIRDNFQVFLHRMCSPSISNSNYKVVIVLGGCQWNNLIFLTSEDFQSLLRFSIKEYCDLWIFINFFIFSYSKIIFYFVKWDTKLGIIELIEWCFSNISKQIFFISY